MKIIMQGREIESIMGKVVNLYVVIMEGHPKKGKI